MATNRNGGAQQGGLGSIFTGQPIAVTFGLIVLGALLVLALLRHLFGSVRVEAGTR